MLDTMHHSLQVLTQQLDQVLQHAQTSRGSLGSSGPSISLRAVSSTPQLILDPQATEALLHQQHVQHEELIRALAYGTGNVMSCPLSEAKLLTRNLA